jgi:hypothetical protein
VIDPTIHERDARATKSRQIFRWINRPWGFDRVLTLVLVFELAGLAIASIIPGLQLEFDAGSSIQAIPPWVAHATGPGAWVLLALVACILSTWLSDRVARVGLPLLVLTLALACPLWAARWTSAAATGSALRWALAAFLIIAMIPLWLRGRMWRPVGPLLNEPAVARAIRLLITFIGAVPILILSIYPAWLTLEGLHIAGVSRTSIFGQMGNDLSYMAPLLVVAGSFIVNAWRERAPAWAFAAGWICNLTVSLGYALSLTAAGQSLDLIHCIRLVQLNVLSAGSFAAAWAAIRWIRQRVLHGESGSPVFLRIEAATALAGNLLLILPATLALIAFPPLKSPMLLEVSSPLGWASLLVTVAAWIWVRLRAFSVGQIAATLPLFSFMLSLSALRWNQANWLSYHLLMIGGVAATGTLLDIGVLIGRARRGRAIAMPVNLAATGAEASAPIELEYERKDRGDAAHVTPQVHVAGEPLQPAFLHWTALLSGFTILLALRALAGDPQGPWWSVGVTAISSLIWTALACWLIAPRLLYAGGILLNLSATMWCLARPTPGVAGLLDIAHVNFAVLAIFGLATLVLHVNVFSKFAQGRFSILVPFHRFTAIAAGIGIAVTVFAMLGCDVVGVPLHNSIWMACGAFVATFVLAGTTLWDRDAKSAIAELYALGLVLIALCLHWRHPTIEGIKAGATVGLSGDVLMLGLLFRMRDQLRRMAGRLGIPNLADPSRWLMRANLLAAAIAVLLALVCSFGPMSMSMKLAAASATVISVIGLILMCDEKSPQVVREWVLGIATAAAVAWAWAWLPPMTGFGLHRSVLMMSALCVCAAVNLLASTRLLKPDSAWWSATRNVFPLILLCWILALAHVLGMEVSSRVHDGSVAMAGADVIQVLAALLLAAAGTLFFAFRPQHDPLQAFGNSSGLQVYFCEALLALMFLHLRLTMPWLFHGRFAQYWPLMVMALAFGGVGLGELLGRRGSRVLARPLFRTGVFLPLLPILGFWLAPSKVDLAVVLFVAGLFYAILSVTRRSFAFGAIAALAANAALWSLLYRQPQLGLLVHPQLWLIPAAVSMLVAAQLNRDRLSLEQLRFVRYCCLMVVYASSTADIFLNGVANHPWLPLVLIVLSVSGVLLGIVLRLRAFLFLGTTFLSIAIVTMIYYASANLHWTWLWYVAGIALGASIIALFALFEKKRDEMIALVEGLKNWN